MRCQERTARLNLPQFRLQSKFGYLDHLQTDQPIYKRGVVEYKLLMSTTSNDVLTAAGT
jgi:hypothetical protein